VPVLRAFLTRFAGIACALVLAACADSRLGTLDARYHVPPLPVHFRTEEDRTEFSLAAHWNNQPDLNHRRIYQERFDGTNLHLSHDSLNHSPYADIEERYRFEREDLVLDGSATWQDGLMYAGLSGGLVPDNPRSFHLGAFAGLAGRLGPFAISSGLGAFRSKMRKEVRYWDYTDAAILDTLLHISPEEDSIYGPDTLSGWTVDWELRANAAVRFGNRTGFAPYLVAEIGFVRFWRWPVEGGDDRKVTDLTLGGGVEMHPFPRVPVRAEIRYGKLYYPGDPSWGHLEGGLHAGWEW
jgi:opacity protein-like surface antigen